MDTQEQQQDQATETVNVVLFCGRVTAWEECLDGIRAHVMDRLRSQHRLLVFASLHKTDDGSDEASVNSFIAHVNPTAANTWHYRPQRPDHYVFSLFYANVEKAPLRAASMMYHRYQAFALLQKYLWENPQVRVNWVVKLRADVQFREAFDLPAAPEPDTIYYPFNSRNYDPCPCHWVPDQVGAGSLATMQKYCAVYPYIYHAGAGALFTPEDILHGYLVTRWRLRLAGVRCEYDLHPQRRANDPMADSGNACNTFINEDACTPNPQPLYPVGSLVEVASIVDGSTPRRALVYETYVYNGQPMCTVLLVSTDKTGGPYGRDDQKVFKRSTRGLAEGVAAYHLEESKVIRAL